MQKIGMKRETSILMGDFCSGLGFWVYKICYIMV